MVMTFVLIIIAIICYLLSESVSRCENDRIKNIYIRMVSEPTLISEQTIKS